MRQIIRRREIVTDDARYPDDTDTDGLRSVPAAAQYLADIAAGKPPAPQILIGPEFELQQLAAQLPHLSLIVVDFPKIGEGRGFSLARLLRERYKYRGELRARGVLKRDQIFFLARCGFDSFHLDPCEDLTAAVAALGSFSVVYQGGSEQFLHLERRSPDL